MDRTPRNQRAFLLAARANHLHVIDIDAPHENAALLVIVLRSPDEGGVGDPRLQGPARRVHLDLGPVIFAMLLDFSLAHIALQIAFHLDAVSDVLVRSLLPYSQ